MFMNDSGILGCPCFKAGRFRYFCPRAPDRCIVIDDQHPICRWLVGHFNSPGGLGGGIGVAPVGRARKLGVVTRGHLAPPLLGKIRLSLLGTSGFFSPMRQILCTFPDTSRVR
jgi:hypothetical protein